MSLQEFRPFEAKLKILLLELEAFKPLFKRIEQLEKWHVENLVKRNDLSMEVSQLEADRKPAIGFLFTTPRQKAIEHLLETLRHVEKDISVGEELLKFVYAFVREKEVATVRTLKKNRLTEIHREFSDQKIRKIKSELQLWKGLVENRLPDECLSTKPFKK